MELSRNLAVMALTAVVVLILFRMLGSSLITNASFTFASYYADHMVLQRSPLRAILWGYAPLDALSQSVKIIVSSSNYSLSYKVDVTKGPFTDKAIWKVKLKPMEASSKSFSITASLNGYAPIKISDVLFGDVWICSGQSNMVFQVEEMDHSSVEYVVASDFQQVRLLLVSLRSSEVPLYDVLKYDRQWSLPSAETMKKFSAVCWVYGRHISAAINIPVGLITTAWGGTPVESWSSPDSLAQCGLSTGEEHWSPDFIPIYPGYPRSKLLQGTHQQNILYNAMIHPFLNMTIAGAIWYQGEANVNLNRDLYNCTFPAMIEDWRTKWFEGTLGSTNQAFPFGFVQLGPNTKTSYIPGFTDIRWHQTADVGFVPNQKMPNIFMAVAVDLTDLKSPFLPVHIRDKGTVGHRLALSGLSIAYQKKGIIFQGPWPTEAIIDYKGLALRLKIIYNDQQLEIAVKNEEGFEVCCTITSSLSPCSVNSSSWVASPIMESDKTSVSLNISLCKGQHLSGLRYLWRQTPCSFKKCPVYSIINDLPAPPYIYAGYMGDLSSTSGKTFKFRTLDNLK